MIYLELVDKDKTIGQIKNIVQEKDPKIKENKKIDAQTKSYKII